MPKVVLESPNEIAGIGLSKGFFIPVGVPVEIKEADLQDLNLRVQQSKGKFTLNSTFGKLDWQDFETLDAELRKLIESNDFSVLTKINRQISDELREHFLMAVICNSNIQTQAKILALEIAQGLEGVGDASLRRLKAAFEQEIRTRPY